jgi:hypothetical protein
MNNIIKKTIFIQERLNKQKKTKSQMKDIN